MPGKAELSFLKNKYKMDICGGVCGCRRRIIQIHGTRKLHVLYISAKVCVFVGERWEWGQL